MGIEAGVKSILDLYFKICDGSEERAAKIWNNWHNSAYDDMNIDEVRRLFFEDSSGE